MRLNTKIGRHAGEDDFINPSLPQLKAQIIATAEFFHYLLFCRELLKGLHGFLSGPDGIRNEIEVNNSGLVAIKIG